MATTTTTMTYTVEPTPAAHPGSVRDFSWSTTDEPHATRRKLILAKHPEMKELFTTEWRTAPMTLGIVLLQLAMAYLARDMSWGWLLFFAYAIGGTANHSLQLAVHELSHNLCFDRPTYNKLTGILANLPTGVPSSITFQKYHMDHHQFQGVDGIDSDVPTQWEVIIFHNTFMKLCWILCQPLFYAFRPLFMKPKPQGMWEAINWTACLAFDFAIYYFLGSKAISYLCLGTILGLGLHPAAGHFIAEHYELVKGYETYSYYGFCNYLNFNVGYHNEHHDFPRIPWSKLPMVSKIAPEFYRDLPYHTSYIAVIWRYITDPEIGPFARVKRAVPAGMEASVANSHAQAKKFDAYRTLCLGFMLGVMSFVFYGGSSTILAAVNFVF